MCSGTKTSKCVIYRSAIFFSNFGRGTKRCAPVRAPRPLRSPPAQALISQRTMRETRVCAEREVAPTGEPRLRAGSVPRRFERSARVGKEGETASRARTCRDGVDSEFCVPYQSAELLPMPSGAPRVLQPLPPLTRHLAGTQESISSAMPARSRRGSSARSGA